MNTFLQGWRILAGILGLTGVMLGAIAAHALTGPAAIISVERVSTYQLIHAIALIIASLLTGRPARIARWSFLIGIVLFCGSIYAKYFFELANATKLAPTGGIFLMVGWLSLAFSGAVKAK